MGEIRYDHGNVRSIAAALWAQADRLTLDAALGAEEAYEEIRREASRYTRSGQPAPIYADVLVQARTALDALTAKADELAKAMQDHADILDGAVTGAQQIEEDAAASLNAVDAGLTPEQQALVGTRTEDGGTYVIGPAGGLHRTKEAWAEPTNTGSTAAAAVLGD
ncbi:hypothetical protein ACTXJJ_06340 [Corynebacterium casei]|uniref:hypothetical protein n=1 Tax=Corynebacterium casei TaxID=160386 RepID=UPI003FB85219